MHVASDMDMLLAILAEKYPHMADVANAMIHADTCMYVANMLIARKELFDEYASWMFDILFELERRTIDDVQTRDVYQQRIYGFLAERMTSIFFEFKRQTAGTRIWTAPVIFIEENAREWRRYRFRMLKRRFLLAIGLGKEKWRRQM